MRHQKLHAQHFKDFSHISLLLSQLVVPKDSETRKLEHNPFTFDFCESLVLEEFDLSKISLDLREHLDSRVEAAHLDSIPSCFGSHYDLNLTNKVDSFFRIRTS